MTEATAQEQIQTIENQIENTQIYKVEAKYSETTNLIEEIKIAEQKILKANYEKIIKNKFKPLD